MKLPAIRLDKEALLNVLLLHGEKFVVAVVAALALCLLWGGIDALRTKTARREQKPAAILAHSAEISSHIERQQKLPENLSLKTVGLSRSIDPWRDPDVQPATGLPLLDKPLFQELSKRTNPDVFPVEQLQAVAGIAIIAVKSAASQGKGAGLDTDTEPREGRRGKSNRGGPGEPEPDAEATGSRLMPYCIVTGLIPATKQQEEYRRRYDSTSFRDPKRDSPLWSDFTIERCVGTPGPTDRWAQIDLAAAAKRASEAWAGTQAEQLPAQFVLAVGQNPGAATGYCGPLPRLADGAWGLESIHPWFAQEMRKMMAARDAAEQPASAAADPPAAADYRIFRFIDTAVDSGKTYRYRVRIKVWNPNFNLPAQHVETAGLARESKLNAPTSNATAAVTVPGLTTLLVRTLRKPEMKRLKTGLVEILVLGENLQTGNFSLRSLVTELGGIINVDRRLNRPAEVRTRGEDIATDRVFVDMRGRQDEREDTRTAKPTPPPEPLEMLFLRADGGFELVTAADSQSSIERFEATLPAVEDPKPVAGDRPAAGPAEPPQPNPFR